MELINIPFVLFMILVIYYNCLVQKNALFCTEQLILLYRRKHSFVQDVFYCPPEIAGISFLFNFAD